jgi:hypothetical protein
MRIIESRVILFIKERLLGIRYPDDYFFVDYEELKEKYKNERPIRYFISSVIIDKYYYRLVDFLNTKKLHLIRKFISKPNIIKPVFVPKHMSSFEKMFQITFSVLVDFVELDLLNQEGFFFKKRDPSAGLEILYWYTKQRKEFTSLMESYLWFTNQYPILFDKHENGEMSETEIDAFNNLKKEQLEKVANSLSVMWV